MLTTKSLTQIALMTALIVVLGFMPPIPLGFIPVPIVLQNLGIMLAATLFAGRRGTLSVVLFLLLGLVMPVFTSGKTTLAVFSGPTAGYVAAWLLVPIAYAGLKRLFPKTHPVLTFVLIWLAGVLLVDVLGSIYLAYFTKAPLLGTLLSNLVFIPGDTIKAVIATLVAGRLTKLSHFQE